MEEAFANLNGVVKEFLPRKSLALENPGDKKYLSESAKQTLSMINSIGVKLDNTLIDDVDGVAYVSNQNHSEQHKQQYLKDNYLKEGEYTYVLPWSIFKHESKYYIDLGMVKLRDTPGGTCDSRVTRINGKLQAEIPMKSKNSVYTTMRTMKDYNGEFEEINVRFVSYEV